MPLDTLMTGALIVVIGGFPFLAFRAARGHWARGGDGWIGGDVSRAGIDSDTGMQISTDSGAVGGDAGGRDGSDQRVTRQMPPSAHRTPDETPAGPRTLPDRRRGPRYR